MILSNAKVLSHERLAGDYFFLRLEARGIAEKAAAGQFVHLRVPALEPSALRRPFSICGADNGVLSILYKQVGRGTAAMEGLRRGDTVSLIGPLGNAFPMPRAGEFPVFVAGGFGVAPLLFLARSIAGISAAERQDAPRGMLFVGGRSAADVLLVDEFKRAGVETAICTNDGSQGTKGFVTAALDKWADDGFPRHWNPAGGAAMNAGAAARKPVFYCCGPEPLLQAVDDRAEARGLDAWLSLDRRMGCAVGACLGCMVALKDPQAGTARVCKDGPIFKNGVVAW